MQGDKKETNHPGKKKPAEIILTKQRLLQELSTTQALKNEYIYKANTCDGIINFLAAMLKDIEEKEKGETDKE